MCSKSYASLFKDVERGDDEGDSLQPLISHDRQPSRPRHLGLSLQQRDRLPHLSLPDITPSSVSSTVTNTPVGETVGFPKHWRRSDRRLRRLNTELLEAIEQHDVEEVERLLNSGASPNATCRLDHVSACHMAALQGGEAMALLVKFGAEKLRVDQLGRTPLHLAAYAGNARQVAILLDFPEDMQERVDTESMSSETEEDIRKLCGLVKEMANVQSDLDDIKIMALPKNWKDNIDHKCVTIEGTLTMFQPGWTPLHVASACARPHCTRLLLAAGADPNIVDSSGRTALDLAGYGHYHNFKIEGEHLTTVIMMLLHAGSKHNTMKSDGLNNMETPLHTAVEVGNTTAIKELLEIGANITCLNSNGHTPLHVCVLKEREAELQLLANFNYKNLDPLAAMVDVKDKDGHTVLQAAVEAAWVPGVCIALESGADVTSKAYDGDTPIHSAAALGNIDVLNEILSIAKQRDALDYQNDEGETALFKAIINGHVECVKQILSEGASIKITLPGNINVFHEAADYGHLEVLRVLLEFNDEDTRAMIDSLSAGDRRGFGPIHFAVSGNYLDCVELLLTKNADIRLRTTHSPHKASTPLHIAAVKNHVDVAKLLLKFDKTTLHEVNSMGWYPLHAASHHGSRDIITLLLREGSDLSGHTDGPKKFRRTAIDMIMHNMSKPTELLEEIFDSFISSSGQDLQDPQCEISVDYGILMPSTCEMEQMKVIEALLKTGNRHGQKKLLVHPLVESFLFLKWKALLPFFYTMIGIYAMFLISLTLFTTSIFFYKDTQTEKPVWLSATIWSYLLYASLILVILQEILYMNVKSSRYFLQTETWIKFSSLALSVILPYAVVVAPVSNMEWPRHVATVALLLSWVEMMFLLSRFPNGGYYVLMFGKVASNVVKILLTFMFLVIGFSLSFMIQFHSQMPFEGPWESLVKTIVMMTSEFDYESLFDEEHNKDLSSSVNIVRFIFLIFLILAAIVLMNLLVGVAVNDINDLEILGNIRRLVKQVEFLSILDTLVYNKIFVKLLPKKVYNSVINKKKVVRVMILSPGKPRWRYSKMLPSRIKNAIYDKAQKLKEKMEDAHDIKVFKTQLDEMYKILKGKEETVTKRAIETVNNNLNDDNNIEEHLDEIDDAVTDLKDQTKCYVTESRDKMEMLNVKMDQLSLDIESIKEFLMRLENKLSS